jgi:hypothetical protein
LHIKKRCSIKNSAYESYFRKALEVPDNEAEQNCAAMAYLAYVEQAIAVPTKLDGAYHAFFKTLWLILQE